MTIRIARTVGLAAAALLVAASMQAQKRDHGRDKGRDKGRAHVTDIRRDDVRNDGVFGRRPNDDVYRDIYRSDRRVPPGLAKKPGQMPPGQFKKRYRAYEGAGVLTDVLRRRGYRVLRVVPSGESRYVYYRQNGDDERWAMVRPGVDRLYFDNVPSSLLQAVLARLY